MKPNKDILDAFEKEFPSPKLSGFTTATEAMIAERATNSYERVKNFISKALDQAREEVCKEQRDGFIENLQYLRDCANGNRYPYWEKEERPDLIIEEIDNLIKHLKDK